MLLPTDFFHVRDLDPPLTISPQTSLCDNTKKQSSSTIVTQLRLNIYLRTDNQPVGHRQLLKQPARFLQATDRITGQGSHVDRLSLHHPLPSDWSHPALRFNHSQCE